MSAKQFYYTVGDRIHPSSELALIDHSKTGDKIRFHTGYDFYNKDWRVEPVESLKELKKKRAQQIRDRYNKVALAYSGGTDSHTVLRSFVENNIKLDEIIINRTNHNPYRVWEYENVTLPLLKEYQKKWKTDIPVTQIKSSMMKNYNEVLTGWKDKNYHSYFREVIRNDFNPIIDHFNHKHNDYDTAKYNSNDCLLWGHEKPKVRILKDYWCWQVKDTDWGNQDTINEHCATEAFFISDDCPEIQIKLAWQLARCLDARLDDHLKRDDVVVSDAQSYLGSIDPKVLRTYQTSGFKLDPSVIYKDGLYAECINAMELTPIAPILGNPNAKPEVTQNKINYLAKLKNEIQDKRMYNETMEYIEMIRSQVRSDLKVNKSLMFKGIWSSPIPIMKVNYKND